MTELSVLFGRRNVRVGLVNFDATLSESHSLSADVTEHPAEEGSNFSDHIRTQPWNLELNGVVSNTPLVFLASLNASSPIENDTTAVQDRAGLAFAELERIMQDGELVTVFTSLREYENMALANLSAQRDAASGNVANMTLSLKEVIVTEITKAEAEPDTAANAPEQNLGSQSTSAAGAATSGASASVAGGFLTAIGI